MKKGNKNIKIKAVVAAPQDARGFEHPPVTQLQFFLRFSPSNRAPCLCYKASHSAWRSHRIIWNQGSRCTSSNTPENDLLTRGKCPPMGEAKPAQPPVLTLVYHLITPTYSPISPFIPPLQSPRGVVSSLGTPGGRPLGCRNETYVR